MVCYEGKNKTNKKQDYGRHEQGLSMSSSP